MQRHKIVHFKRECVLLIAALALSAFARAEASFRVQILDASGAPLSNQKTTVTGPAGTSTHTTAADGSVLIPNNQPGHYTLTVTRPGFAVSQFEFDAKESTDYVINGRASGRGVLVFKVSTLSRGQENKSYKGLPTEVPAAPPSKPEGVRTDYTPLAGTPPSGARAVRNDYTPCLFRSSDYKAFLKGFQPGGPTGGQAAQLNISCSQSLMTWKETSDIFGRRIADRYVAIQVVIRNLDPDHEFLVHDVQVAAGVHRKVGTTGALQHPDVSFSGGRDKVLVRGVALKGQSLDRRNFLIHVGEVIGDLASAASIALTSLDFKNAVGVYRSAFLPGMGRIFPDLTVDQLNRLNDTGFSANSAYKIVVAKSGSVPFVTFVPSEIYAAGYKKFDQAKLRELLNHTLVVFGGVHIAPLNDQPVVNSFTCPQQDGFLDVSKDGDYTCKLAGDNLSAISRVRFVSGSDSSEAFLEASVGTDGSVTFKVDDLRKLRSPEYQIHTVDKNGRERNTGLTAKMRPVVTSVSAGKCDQTAATCTLTLEGTNLQIVNGIAADCGDARNDGLRDMDASAGANQFYLQYDGVNGKTGCKISIQVGSEVVDTGKTVDFK
jgi:hypothetical protein